MSSLVLDIAKKAGSGDRSLEISERSLRAIREPMRVKANKPRHVHGPFSESDRDEYQMEQDV